MNDASSDGTGPMLDCLAAAGVIHRVIHHSVNCGKGASLRSGIAAATGDVVVAKDADLEYEPADLPCLLDPIQSGRADAVYG